jgi:hypothetical protein
MRPIRDEYLVARETEMPRPQRRKPQAARNAEASTQRQTTS